MSRSTRALIASVFSYLRYGLALVSGIVLVPFVLGRLGDHTYGLWMAMGELLAYAAFADLGLLSILPWVIAEADGRRDTMEVRSLIVHGLALSGAAAAAYGLVMLTLWSVLPGVLSLSAQDQTLVRGPILIIVLATMLTYPLRIFEATLVGLQDVVWMGIRGVVHILGTITLTVSLLLAGYGLYSMALAATLPPLVMLCLDIARLS